MKPMTTDALAGPGSMPLNRDHRHAVTGAPRLILRAEGAALFLVSTFIYLAMGGGWGLFAVLFFVPDVFMVGYLRNTRVGAFGYNLGHSTLLPLATIAAGYALEGAPMVHVGLIWLAHIGFDRMLGYGLKYPDSFRHTHLSTPFTTPTDNRYQGE